MKKTKPAKYLILAFLFCVIAAAVWYRMPTKLLRVDPNDVTSITIFDGSRGEQTEITDADRLRRMAENLASVTVRRRGLSLGYTGYRFRVEVYAGGEKPAARFIVNSAGSIRNDPFFYRVEEGQMDFAFLESLFS